ncbi:hypothetical protein BB560_005052 [Smittium megazygosporum]|uniref:Uncharacterized protein n=1 Tax=Smittium megazygosporum TaxID=133381 RepID=A0A2T9Z7N5_9FUNG|nr:hypothetical protein BB560_005052 [Smittium megazygosporum]
MSRLVLSKFSPTAFSVKGATPKVYTQVKRNNTTSTDRGLASEKDSSASQEAIRADLSYFIPGVRGYSPEFPPPKNWNPVPKPKKALKKSEDLPPPSAFQKKELDPKTVLPRTLYRQKLTRLRYKYYKEYLENMTKKEELRLKKEKVEKEAREKKEEERVRKTQEYIEKVISDPFSPYNVLNPQGTTVLSNIETHPNTPNSSSEGTSAVSNDSQSADSPSARARDDEKDILLKPFEKVRPPRVTVSYPVEENELAKKIRAERRVEFEESVKTKKLETLVELFYETSSFVTYKNLDSKVEEFFKSNGLGFPFWSTMESNSHSENTFFNSREALSRKTLLSNVLNETSGPNQLAGLNYILEFSENKKNTSS